MLDLGIVGMSEERWNEENDFWSRDFRTISTKGIKGKQILELF